MNGEIRERERMQKGEGGLTRTGLSIFHPVESRLIIWLPIGFYDFLGSSDKGSRLWPRVRRIKGGGKALGEPFNES